MSSNPHYAEAESCLNSVAATSGAEFAAEYRQLARIEASLAIAWEQRTANLIAVWQSESPLEGLNYKRLGVEIKERLGL
ncbi:MAG TPA: hypothetical protein VIQ52_09420 [Arthrobacter sp.]